MKIDLDELLQKGVIKKDTYTSIKDYYESKARPDSGSRLLQIVSLLGIVLVGLGIILVIGYNWNTMLKPIKLILACLPLILSQGIGFFTLIKKQDQKLWHEISATAILFGIGIAMALISQIYNIEPDLSQFIKWWLVLSIALIFIFDSGFCSLLIWAGIGWFILSNPVNREYNHIYWSLGFIITAIVSYTYRVFHKSDKAAWAWHSIAIPIVLIIFSFVISSFSCQKLVLAQLLLLFFVFQLVPVINRLKGLQWVRLYNVFSFVGVFIMAFIYSYKSFWNQGAFHLSTDCYKPSSYFISISYLVVCMVVYFFTANNTIWKKLGFFDSKYLILFLFLVTLFGNQFPDLTTVIVNIILLLSAAMMIYEGIQLEDLIKLNLGILILIIWVIGRFFGTDLSLLTKGIVFILLGLVCFYLNYLLIQRKKA